MNGDRLSRSSSDLRRRFRDSSSTCGRIRSTEDQIGDDLLRAENYLSLVGFVILVLGGIGVWSVTRVFVRQKIRSVAILKCLGATTARCWPPTCSRWCCLAWLAARWAWCSRASAIAAIPARVGAALGGSSYGADGVGSLAGCERRAARVAPVLARAAARSAAGEATAAAARHDCGTGRAALHASWWTVRGLRERLARLDWRRSSRLSSSRRRWWRSRLAGRVATRRADRLRRVRRASRLCCTSPARRSSAACVPSRASGSFRCGTRSSASAVRATRHA